MTRPLPQTPQPEGEAMPYPQAKPYNMAEELQQRYEEIDNLRKLADTVLRAIQDHGPRELNVVAERIVTDLWGYRCEQCGALVDEGGERYYGAPETGVVLCDECGEDLGWS